MPAQGLGKMTPALTEWGENCITPKRLCVQEEPCHLLHLGSQSRAMSPRAYPGGQGSF